MGKSILLRDTETSGNILSSKTIMEPLYSIAEFLFLFFCMCFPATYSFIRMPLLFVWVIVILIEKLNRRIFIPPQIIIVFTIYYVSVFVSMIEGLAFGSAGFLQCLRFDAVYPILFLVIASSFISKERFKLLLKYLIIIQTIICIWDVWYCLYGFGLLPFPAFLLGLESEYSFGNYGLFVQYFTNHMITHAFMFPLLTAVAFRTRKIRYYLLLLLELICVVLSGRVALQITAVVSLAVIVFYFFITKQKNKLRSFKLLTGVAVGVIVLLIVLSTFTSISFASIFEYGLNKITNSFSSNDSGDSVRYDQLIALTNGFLDKPIFGNGIGSYTLECVRDYEYPWNYELFYNLILFQKGIVGLLAMFALYGVILYGISKTKILDSYGKAGFVLAFLSIVIASSVDPYLGTSGCLWMVYIPLSFTFYNYRERKEL